MRCPRCHHENREEARFCAACGASCAARCPACGHQPPSEAAFCDHCGTSLNGTTTAATRQPLVVRSQTPQVSTPPSLVEKTLQSRTALEGERKQVTVLFADLKGSMELLADCDPEEACMMLDPVLERMMAAVRRYEGTVNQVMGDGIMALFGTPIAHEDHAVRACYAALHMQESIGRYAEELRLRQALDLEKGMVGADPRRIVRCDRVLSRHGHDALAAPGEGGTGAGGGAVMDLSAVVDQVIGLTRRRGWTSYTPTGACKPVVRTIDGLRLGLPHVDSRGLEA
jgi:Adenylate and Guanylate cyclase catalytic domain/Double zinc ribbon